MSYFVFCPIFIWTQTNLFLKNEKTNTLSLGTLKYLKNWQKNQYLIQIIILSRNYEIFVLLENFVQNVQLQYISII